MLQFTDVSVFLERPQSDWIASNGLAFAIRDGFPVSRGHTLVVPRRVVATWFDSSEAEKAAIISLIDEVKRKLDEEFHPDGYNVGFNAGAAAGQTVMHLHVHVIPRYLGDMEDPRGGVRHVIPDKGNYLQAARVPLTTGGTADPFLSHISPLFRRASDVSILAAFVQDSGLETLANDVRAALKRGARIRIITGDYLNITQARALRRLLDWSAAERGEGEDEIAGEFEARVVETALLEVRSRSFHPKSWRFEGPNLASAFVGSSNISRSALSTGFEWNLRVDRQRDQKAFASVVEAFESWWLKARPLSAEWVEDYALRARDEGAPAPPGEDDQDPLAPPPPKHEIQLEALERLAEARVLGRRKAVAVLATGLGKTWLAAFDVQAFQGSKTKIPRVLFLAHRYELLSQAAETFRRLYPDCSIGWLVGTHDLGKRQRPDIVVASIQKLAIPKRLGKFLTSGFDPEYVIVDEVHHATALSYRRVLDLLQPKFLLGLTATPDRADEADVVGLFDDYVAFRADLGEGISRRLLVPFQYFGLKDESVDYSAANIPWANKRFDPEALARAVQTERRMEQMWAAWSAHPGTRTLVFCCSIEHARYARTWLAEKGVRIACVHSADDSDDPSTSLRSLADGTLDAICAVDILNEGIDVPAIDRVVMLRPTESPVVFLQQLGRGLRRNGDWKKSLTVIDFVGNHRVFLDRIRRLVTLASKADQSEALRDFLEGKEVELPPECSIFLEVEAKDLLKSFLPAGRSLIERVFREILASRGERPTIGELFRLGYAPSTLQPTFDTWFDFLKAEDQLSDNERAILDVARPWFQELETTALSKCFKMVTLEALLETDALLTDLPIAALAARSYEIILRSPELSRDLDGVKELPDPRAVPPAAWEAYWRKNPLRAWSEAKGRKWFTLKDGVFSSALPKTAPESTLVEMTREIVDYRLAKYRKRLAQDASGDAFEAKVTWNQRDPIIKLPEESARPGFVGEQDIRLSDGSVWRFKLATKFCNVAHRVGSAKNELPDLLRSWFGPDAGRPSTAFYVRFSLSPDGWWIAPVGGKVMSLPNRNRIVAFPTLRAAAGHAQQPSEAPPDPEHVFLPGTAVGNQFAVRATGDSMNGGKAPIRDGDWLVLQYARGASPKTIDGRVSLVQSDDKSGHTFQIKRIVKSTAGWTLKSDNPDSPSFEATSATVPIATLVSVFRPEDLAPSPGSWIEESALAEHFGMDVVPRSGRSEGHLFAFIEQVGSFKQPDRLAHPVVDRRPGETLFVLTRIPERSGWRYGGVAHWSEAESLWVCPPLDHASWRSLGASRTTSNRLPEQFRQEALERVAAISQPGFGNWIARGPKRCRLVRAANDGGLVIDGGDGGMKERPVSATDIAWVLAAQADIRANGGVLDEARVNRLRYLEGTPKASTRWIDTGWAIVLVDPDPSMSAR